MLAPNYDDGLYDEDDEEIEKMKHMLKNTLADIERMEIKKPSLYHDFDSKENENINIPREQNNTMNIISKAANDKKNISNAVNEQLNVIFDSQRKVLNEITEKVHSKLEQHDSNYNVHHNQNKFDQSSINNNGPSFNDYFTHTNNTNIMSYVGKDITNQNVNGNNNIINNSASANNLSSHFGGSSFNIKNSNYNFNQPQTEAKTFNNTNTSKGAGLVQNDLSIKKPFTSGPTHSIYVPKFSSDNSLSIRSFIKK